MVKISRRKIVCASVLLLLAALLLAAPAFAVSGDYGVNSGASAESSNCGGADQPACSITLNGYNLTYSNRSSAYFFYSFDAFNCTAAFSADGSGLAELSGTACDQYQP